MAEEFKYIILGGGNASGYAAREFLAQGLKAGELAIITDEPVVAYERPALSKGYLAPEGGARLPGFHTTVGGGGERQTPEWYTEKGITFKTSTRVTALDAATRILTLSNGTTLRATQALIIATGARALTLGELKLSGAELGGVHTLRNEADAASLVAAAKEAKAAGGKAVVVGGGYIGLEVAAGLVAYGLHVTLVAPEDKLLARLFTAQISSFYEKFYAAKGITILKGTTAVGLTGEGGKVSGVTVAPVGGGASHTLPASLVVVGVGARAVDDLAQGQLKLAGAPVGGIEVDSHFRTSVNGLWAIGDVAAFPLLRAGGALVRQEHVTHARSSAAHAVKAIYGVAPSAYDYLPYFYSRVFNLSWQFWGTSTGEVVHFGDFEGGKFGAYWVDGGKVVGVFLESASAEEQAGAKAVAAAQPPAPSPASSLAATTPATLAASLSKV